MYIDDLLIYEVVRWTFFSDDVVDITYRGHDGTSLHYGRNVGEHLGITFPIKWKGWGGPYLARPPDLTKLDFLLWGHFKRLVYEEPPTIREDMME